MGLLSWWEFAEEDGCLNLLSAQSLAVRPCNTPIYIQYIYTFPVWYSTISTLPLSGDSSFVNAASSKGRRRVFGRVLGGRSP